MERHDQKFGSSFKGSRFSPFKKTQGRPKQFNASGKNSDSTRKEPADKTREILRLVLPINKSGSKQLILAADPTTGFLPSLTIRTPGSPGIKLNGPALEKFIACFHQIDDYFKHGGMDDMELLLSKERSVTFGKSYDDRAVFLKMKAHETEKEYSIILNSFTWGFLISMHSLIKYTIQNLNNYSAELQKMAETLKNYIATKINLKEAIKLDEVEEVFAALNGEEVAITPNPDCSLDYVRAFYEMKRYCIHDIMCSALNE
jgi:hypothetical protein